MLVALDSFLTDTRSRRLEKELRAALTARFELLEEAIQAHYVTLPRSALMDCRPRYIDFAFTPEVRAIAGAPTSEIVTVEQFAAVVAALAAKWDADRRKELAAYLRPHLGKVAAGVDPLTLAIAVFRAKHDQACNTPIALMRYPVVLSHAHSFSDATCMRGTDLKDAAAFRKQDVYTRTVQSLTWRKYEFEHLDEHPEWPVSVHTPFHVGGLAKRADAGAAVKGMRRIVTALGLDPARATFDDLERCDGWLRCVTCESDEPHANIWALSWRSAVSVFCWCPRLDGLELPLTCPLLLLQYEHDEDHVTMLQEERRKIPEWRRVDDEDMEKVRASEEDELPDADFEKSAVWSCSLCPAFDAIWTEMSAHLEQT